MLRTLLITCGYPVSRRKPLLRPLRHKLLRAAACYTAPMVTILSVWPPR